MKKSFNIFIKNLTSRPVSVHIKNAYVLKKTIILSPNNLPCANPLSYGAPDIVIYVNPLLPLRFPFIVGEIIFFAASIALSIKLGPGCVSLSIKSEGEDDAWGSGGVGVSGVVTDGNDAIILLYILLYIYYYIITLTNLITLSNLITLTNLTNLINLIALFTIFLIIVISI